MKISSFLILLTTIIPLNLLHGAQGTVFNDKNQNGKKDDGEPGLPNIAVSNGKDITKTNAQVFLVGLSMDLVRNYFA